MSEPLALSPRTIGTSKLKEVLKLMIAFDRLRKMSPLGPPPPETDEEREARYKREFWEGVLPS